MTTTRDSAREESSPPASPGPARRLRLPWSRPAGSPSIFGSASSFSAPVGSHIDPGSVRGYYIDFRSKARAAAWPPEWFEPGGRQLYVASAQWGLACFERHVAGEGEQWLAAARACADYFVSTQEPGGGWVHRFPYFHTYRLSPPWLSGMAQGEGASLLVRVHSETGEERLAEVALRALEPMRVPAAEGGVAAELDGGFFPEEYPTDPPSFVLNGGLFGLWGCYDAAVALGDAGARELFDDGASALARALDRYDTGYWSRYDLFPHPVRNVASAAYHRLHIDQLRAMALIAPQPDYSATADRFELYAARRLNTARATAAKVAFRIAVPRNRLLAHRLPWGRGG